MELAYGTLSAKPVGCVKFFGITVLAIDQDESANRLCLVFERASRGTIIDYINEDAKSLSWFDVVLLFQDIALALARDLHKRGIVHR
jgi:serine/threonine protein kinase